MGKNGYISILSTDYCAFTSGGSVILNISSIQDLMTWPAVPTYSAAKAGMITYTRSAGHQLEYQVYRFRFICLCSRFLRPRNAWNMFRFHQTIIDTLAFFSFTQIIFELRKLK